MLFSSEMGELSDYKGFLSRYTAPLRSTHSVLSGKKVVYSSPYSSSARFISFDESTRLDASPFDINDIKDVDSLLSSARERLYYSGNKVAGHSKNVVESENCVDSFNVVDSQDVYGCDCVAYCQMIMESKHVFGCSFGAINQFCMNTVEGYKSVRCFESTYATESRDLYYCFKCVNCEECMFSFSLYSKKYCVGNNELPRDKYVSLKSKLVAEMAEALKSNKTLPSVTSFASM